MTLSKIRKGSLVDHAIDGLREAITQRDWPVGERLPTEGALAETLGVSRNTVREAVRVLVHSGMLETRQGDGTYVRASVDAGDVFRRIDRSALRDRLEVRLMLETEAAGLAAIRHQEQDLRAMTAALSGREAAGDDVDQRIEEDEHFHRSIVAASHNPALIELYDYFAAGVRQTIMSTETDQTLPAPSHADHQHLLEAIRFRDSEAAREIARALLTPSLQALEGIE